MRLTSAVPALVRRTVADTEIVGYHVPQGCHVVHVVVVPGVSHRLERFWTEPDRFDPERFAEHRREDKPRRFAPCRSAAAHRCVACTTVGSRSGSSSVGCCVASGRTSVRLRGGRGRVVALVPAGRSAGPAAAVLTSAGW